MLKVIKAFHTAIWLVMTLAIFYIGYCVIRMDFGAVFYGSLILVVSEIVVIVVNSWKCPLTSLARRYTDEAAPNFDIFLPRIIAQYNKEIFSVILFVILVIYIKNALS
jgi:hypothetical protein